MRHSLLVGLIAVVASLSVVGAASAQSGHFNLGGKGLTCIDNGTTLTCSGKVSGLGGTTFQITVSVQDADASVLCFNPAGGAKEDTGVPGQGFSFTAAGTTGEQTTPRNGSFNFSFSTATPLAPAGSCPSAQWTTEIDDVDFCGLATLTLFENGSSTPSDTTTVQLQPLANCQ
jgi:hypothetical protein